MSAVLTSFLHSQDNFENQIFDITSNFIKSQERITK